MAIRQRHAAEPIALDVVDAVQDGQPFVEVGVVGGQQVDHVLILAEDAIDEHLQLGQIDRARVAGIREDVHVRIDLGQLAHSQPLVREVGSQRLGPGIGQHAVNLLLEDARVTQMPRHRDVEQLLIGRAAPQEERQPRGEFEIGDLVGAAGAHVLRSRLRAIQEEGARENCRQPVADSLVEAAAVLPALTVERHEQLRV